MAKKIVAPTFMQRITRILLVCGSALVLIFAGLLLMPRPTYRDGFKNLADVTTYVAQQEENYTLDSENTTKPEFNKYYTTLKPTWHRNLLEKLVWLGSFVRLTKPPIWAPSFFKNQMLTLAKQQTDNSFKGETVVKLKLPAGAKIVLFGNIQGALHSMARYLVKLKELGIIDDQLVITKPEFYIMFMGDVVSRSRYTMPTLSLVCKLLQKNPKNVIYLRGNHESKNYWQEHTLKAELQTLAAYLDKGMVPLEREVNGFFATLPIGAYVAMSDEKNADVLRISDVGRMIDERLHEDKYATFLTTKASGPVAVHTLGTSQAAGPAVKVRVIFRGEKKRETYQPHQGLRLLQPDMDSVAWTLLSCPTALYRKAIKFKHDSFVILQPASTPEGWTVTQYNRDVESKDPFKATVFNLLTGATDDKTVQIAAPVEPKESKKVKEPVASKESKPEKVAKPVAQVVPVISPVTPDQTTTTTLSAVIKQAEILRDQAADLAVKARTLLEKDKQSNTTISGQQIPARPEEPAGRLEGFVREQTTPVVIPTEPSAFKPVASPP